MEKSANHHEASLSVVVSKTMAIILLVTGFAAPFILLHFSIFAGDEQYQTLNAISDNTNAVAPLSSLLTKLWGRVFGFSMVSMRTLAACLSTATTLLGAGYYFAKSRRIWPSIWVAGACLLLSSSCQVFSYAIGWDVFSNFFIVGTLIPLLIYTDSATRSTWLLVLSGAMAALATASRLPSATLTIASFVPIMLNRRVAVKLRLCNLIIFYVSYAVLLITVIWVIFGSVGEFAHQLDVFSSSSLSDDHTFNFFRLLYPFLTSLIPTVGFFLSVYALLIFVSRRSFPKWVSAVILCTFAASMAFTSYKPDFDAFNIPVLLTNLFFCLVGILVHQRITPNGKGLLFPLTLVVFTLPSAAFSLVAFSKILVVPLFPILLTRLKINPTLKRFSIACAIIVTVVVTYYKLQYAWYDRGLRYTHTEINVPVLKGIFTTERRAVQFEEIYSVANRMGKHITVGRGRFLVEYVTGEANEESRHYFYTTLNNEKYADLIAKILKNEPQEVLMIDLDNLTTIHEDIFPEYKLNTVTQKRLEELGYNATEEGDYYMIYSPPKTE